MKLTPAQVKALVNILEGSLEGVRGATLARLERLGLVRLWTVESVRRFRPAAHGFTRERWSQTVSGSDCALTEAGRNVAEQLRADMKR